MIRIKVVLPAPLRPSKAKVCPAGMSRDTSLNTRWTPNDFATFSSRIMDLLIRCLQSGVFRELVFGLRQSRAEHVTQFRRADPKQKPAPHGGAEFARELFTFLFH